MLSRVHSLGLRGAEGYPVLVELDLADKGLPGFTTVGLPDGAVREARQRVTAAVRNTGFRFPAVRVTVNLAPAQSRKQGSHYDLPIALAFLSASGQLPGRDWPRRYCFAGELALDGSLRPVRGALSMAARAKDEGFAGIVLPRENAGEAAASGLPCYGAVSLREVADFLSGEPHASLSAAVPAFAGAPAAEASCDFSDVKGQRLAKRALELAAAGGHHVLLVGPPGAGKSMLARRLPTILPPLSEAEAVELARIRAARPELGLRGLAAGRPFRAPHHSASQAALIGGGPAAAPGEVSLAHGGVLFLDELAEFNRAALEALRQPLEDGKVVVARARETAEYPARFRLVAAANPCPCGWRGHPRRPCVCAPPAVARYAARLSGPLLDRIDIQVEVEALPFEQWAGEAGGAEERSETVRARVEAARQRQSRRGAAGEPVLNARLPARDLRRHCALRADGLGLLARAARRWALSARSLDRILRVARTIADLEDRPAVGAGDLAEAVQYRCLERWQAPETCGGAAAAGQEGEEQR